MMSCREASRLYSESMDHKLPLSKMISLRFHLMMCSMCRRFSRQLEFIRRAAPAFAAMEADLEEPSGVKLSPEARARIVSALTST
jgi:hypothetical protein